MSTATRITNPYGRPKKHARRKQISLYLTEGELLLVDLVREDQDRNAWIRSAINLKLGTYEDKLDALVKQELGT